MAASGCTLGDGCICTYSRVSAEERFSCKHYQVLDRSPPQDLSSPPTPGPAAKPAEDASPPRPATADGGRFSAQLAMGWLYGFCAAHPTNAKEATAHLNIVDRFIDRTTEVDPKQLWSADYGLADKLGNQLEALNADLALLQKDLTLTTVPPALTERLGAIKASLEAAIKTCNELGLPF